MGCMALALLCSCDANVSQVCLCGWWCLQMSHLPHVGVHASVTGRCHRVCLGMCVCVSDSEAARQHVCVCSRCSPLPRCGAHTPLHSFLPPPALISKASDWGLEEEGGSSAGPAVSSSDSDCSLPSPRRSAQTSQPPCLHFPLPAWTPWLGTLPAVGAVVFPCLKPHPHPSREGQTGGEGLGAPGRGGRGFTRVCKHVCV